MSIALTNGKSSAVASRQCAASSAKSIALGAEISALGGDERAIAARLAEVEIASGLAAMTQLNSLFRVLSSADAQGAVDAIADAAMQLVGCAGVRIVVRSCCGLVFTGAQGVAEVITRALDAAGLDAGGSDADPSDASGIRSFDVARAPDLAGTFLQGLLREQGFTAVHACRVPFAQDRCAGTVHVFCRDGAELQGTARQVLATLCSRLAFGLESIWSVAEGRGHAAHLRAILDSAHDSIICIDPRGVVQSINATTTKMLGYTAEDLVGRTLDVMMSDSDSDKMRAGLVRFAATRERRVTGALREVEVRRKDGTTVTIDLAVNEIEGGRGFTGILRDISTRKRVEAQMRESDRLAAIGTLAAGLGHDMSNMLFPIRAHLNVLASNEKRLPRERRDMHIAEIRSGVTYLQHLADSLHFLAMDPDAEGDGLGLTDLWTWWKQTGPLLKNALRRSADLDVSIAMDLPPIVVAQHALTRAVLNLLVNAGEAMPKDRPRELAKVVIRAHAAPGGDAVLLEVADNGTGMTEEVRRRALDMFFTTKTRGIGTGLGLPLVRGVVERAGGSVDIDSRVGLGTTIRLRLPIATEAEEEVSPSAWVQMSDGRAGAIVRAALEARGVTIESAAQFDGVDIRVVDRDHISVEEARRWIGVHPAPHLVVIGALSPNERRELAALGVTLVPNHSDLAAIEAGLDAALAHQQKEHVHD